MKHRDSHRWQATGRLQFECALCGLMQLHVTRETLKPGQDRTARYYMRVNAPDDFVLRKALRGQGPACDPNARLEEYGEQALFAALAAL